MIDLYLVAAYVAAIVLFLGTPGPVTVLVANASVRGGLGAGILTVAGTNTSSLLLISASFLAIQGLFSVNEQALTWLAFLGSFYLIYFAVPIIFSRVHLEKGQATVPRKGYFWTGFAVGLSNPKDVLFFIAFFPTFLGVSPNMHFSMLVLVLVWIVLDYLILSGYALVFSRYLNNKIANIVSRASGALLLLVALYSLHANGSKLFF